MKEWENEYEKEQTTLKAVKKILHMHGKEVNFRIGLIEGGKKR